MAGCTLTKSITKKNCTYDIAGVVALYLINYDRRNEFEFDANGQISGLTLPTGQSIYKVDFLNNTASFTDELAEGGNGGKYRTHTVNFSIGKLEYDEINQGDAMSLGKFTAILVDKHDNCFVLGRNHGLSATSFNYESGAADADAKGWTVVMAGTEKEIAPLLTSESILADLLYKTEQEEAGNNDVEITD